MFYSFCPPLSKNTSFHRSDSFSSDSRAQRRQSSTDQHLQDRPVQRDRQSEPSRAYATRSSTQTGTEPFSSQTETSERRPVTPSVMADLELEPVSPEDDSLDNVMEEEDGVEEDDSKRSDKKGDAGSREGQKAPSSEGQRSDSQEEGEGGERRRKNRVPIELVDFGEAARHARASAGTSGSSSTTPGSWSSRRPDGRVYGAQPATHAPPLPPPPPQPLHQSQRSVFVFVF